jgi:uncharacterized protein
LRVAAEVNARDAYGRTPLHVATYAGKRDVMRALARAGADANALERDRYDIVTIAAVADDMPMLKVALESAAAPATSPAATTVRR